MTKYLSVGGQAEIAVLTSLMPDESDGIVWKLHNDRFLITSDASATPLQPSPRLLGEIHRALTSGELPIWLEFEEAELPEINMLESMSQKGLIQPVDPNAGFPRKRATTGITLDLTAKDFQRLYDVGSQWDEDRERQYRPYEPLESRFEFMESYNHHPGDLLFSRVGAHAYWVGERWEPVIFMKAFLRSVNQSYEVLWDMHPSGESLSYVIITPYHSED